MIDPHDTRVVLVEGVDRLVGSMGPRLSRLTARDLTRMGVEIHLDAMVTNMDDDGVEITKQDGQTSGSRPPPRSGRPAPGPRLWGPRSPTRPAPSSTRRAASWSSPTARLPGIPRSSSWAT